MNANNMPQDENNVIRYLMKEMDPSEEVLMERAMMEDDDLLIEVESMRQTLGRMDDLPEKAPPPELSESIIAQAGEHKPSRWAWPSVPSQFYRYAAVLLVGIGLGSGAWFLGSSSFNKPAKQPLHFKSVNTASNTSARQTQNTKPWVDNHNVIYFQDKFSPHSTAYQSIIKTSMKKLTPVNNPASALPFQSRRVQLTGSHR